MTYRPGYADFFHNFRGKECIVIYSRRDNAEWWIAPLDEDGSEGESFQDLTPDEEETIGTLVNQVAIERSLDS